MAAGKGRMPGDDLVLISHTACHFRASGAEVLFPQQGWGAAKSRWGVKVNGEKNTAESWVSALIGDPCAFQVIVKREGFAHRKTYIFKIMAVSSTLLSCMQKRPLPQYASLSEN